jgi:bifunctional DNA-binding transcriptional regulator/antitoxin component of YhaV-PrlF toxin-antitoxin module
LVFTLEVSHSRITQNKQIKIPDKILDMLGLKSGEEIKMTVVNKKLIVEASADPVDGLSGIIKIKETEAEKLIESEEWY